MCSHWESYPEGVCKLAITGAFCNICHNLSKGKEVFLHHVKRVWKKLISWQTRSQHLSQRRKSLKGGVELSAYHHAHHYQSMRALRSSKSCLMVLWQWRSGHFAVIKLIYCAFFEQPVMTAHLRHATHLNLHFTHVQDEKDSLDTLSETVF